MSRIDKLTPAQEARLAEFRALWLATGLSTEPANRPAAEAAIAAMYRSAKLDPPRLIIWGGSPFSSALARAIMLSPPDELRRLVIDAGDQVVAQVWDQVGDQVGAQVGAQVGDQVWDQVGDQVWDQVGDQVWDQVGDQVWDQVRAQVWAQVRAQVGAQVVAQVWDQVGAQVRAQVGDQVWDQVWDQVRAQVWAQVRAQVGDQVRSGLSQTVWGQHDAGWLSFYDYFREACGLTAETDKLQGLVGLARNAGWAIPHRNVCWVSERPALLLRNERGRLHSLTGPAVRYPDGWSIYAVDGTRVPAKWIENKASLDPKTALTWRNIEERRAAITILGWARVLEELEAKVVNKDRNPLIGTLLRADLPDAPGQQFLKVRCGTGRDFVLPVPPDVTTAREANAWTYGLSPKELRLEART